MAVLPGGGRDPRDRHGMEQELESFVECKRHVLKYQTGDLFRARCFVVWGAAENFLHDGWGDVSENHRDSMLLVGRNVAEPWERCSVFKRGVR